MGKKCNQGRNHPKFIDLTGNKFGKLTLLEYVQTTQGNRLVWCWKCLCECGNYTYTRTKEFMKDKPVQSCRSCGFKRMGKTNLLPNHKNLKNKAFHCYKRNASNRNYEFDISFDKFVELIGKNCHYCDSLPHFSESENFYNKSDIPFERNGIDRIDNSKGYIDGNIITCCKRCNIAKSTMSYQEFIELINKIYHNLNK